MAVLLGVFMGACATDDDFRKDAVEASCYLTLQVRLSSDGTRTDDNHSEHPENSDQYTDHEGLVAGTDAENRIKDLTFFFVDKECAEAGDVNDIIYSDKSELFRLSQKDLPFVAALHISIGKPLPKGLTYDAATATLRIRIDDGKTIRDRYAMTAVANMGDLSAGNPGIENIFTDPDSNDPVTVPDAANGLTSLYKLREYLITNAWENETIDGKNTATCFRMSGINIPAGGGVLFPVLVGGESGPDGSETNPFRARCDLMRVAARIDLGCNRKDDANPDTGVTYGTINEQGEVEYVAYEKSSDSSGDGSTPARLGKVYLTGVEIFNRLREDAVNVYALRHTVEKNAAENFNATTTTLSACAGGMECGGLLKRNEDAQKTELYYVADPYFTMKKTLPEDEDPNTGGYYDNTYRSLWERVGNDTNGNGDSGLFAVSMSDLTEHKTDDYDISKGFNRTLTLGYVKENTYDNSHLDPGSPETFNTRANTNYATGLLLKTVFVPDKVYTDAACTEADAITEISRGTTFHMWRGTATDGEVRSIFFLTNKAAEDYKTYVGEGEVSSFKNGVGYHELFIEHADAAAPPMSVMKHGVVRNNVYRVLLTFKGPGKTLYSETPQDLEWHIYTRNWNLREWNMREEPEIVL